MLSKIVKKKKGGKPNICHFRTFVADMDQKRSFNTVSHKHLLTINITKYILFGSSMGQTKHKPTSYIKKQAAKINSDVCFTKFP